MKHGLVGTDYNKAHYSGKALPVVNRTGFVAASDSDREDASSILAASTKKGLMNSKFCRKCCKELPISAFSQRPERKSGVYSSCRKCKSLAGSLRAKRNRIANPVAIWIRNAVLWAAYRAKHKQIIFEIDKTTVAQALQQCQSLCTYCAVPLHFLRTKNCRQDSPTIDRLIPALGYTASNIVICCFRCNVVKGDATVDELRRIVTKVEELTKPQFLSTSITSPVRF